MNVLSSRLQATHAQDVQNLYELTQAVSLLLDAMADNHVKGLSREQLHLPLETYLRSLKSNAYPFLVYQAAYAHQALLYVPDDETPWQAAMRHTGQIVQGVSKVVSAVKAFDLN